MDSGSSGNGPRGAARARTIAHAAGPVNAAGDAPEGEDTARLDAVHVNARVGQADVALPLARKHAAEVLARAEGDARLLERGAAERAVVGQALPRHGLGDVGKEVERGLGPVAADAGDVVEHLDGPVAPLAEHAQDLARAGGVAGEALQGGVLHEVVGAGLLVDVQFDDAFDEFAGSHRRTQAPAGHGELLAEGVEDEASLGHVRQGDERLGSALVADVEVGLVAEDKEVVTPHERGDVFEFLAARFGAGGILEVVEDEEARAGRDMFLQVVEAHLEVALPLAEAVGHRAPAPELDLRLVEGIARAGVERLVARLQERLEELVDHRLAAGLDGDVLGGVARPVRAVDLLGEFCAQFRDAGRRAVAGLSRVDGAQCGLDDVARRGQVHVAQVEGVHRFALRLAGGRLGAHGKGRLGAQAFHASGKPHAASPDRVSVEERRGASVHFTPNPA